MMRRLTLLAVAALLCLASAARTNYMPQIAQAPPGVTDGDMFAAAYRVLTDEGYSIRDKDRDAGIVTTEWISVDTEVISGDITYHAWRVVIEEGELRLSIDCEMYIKSQASRITCGGNSRIESFAAKEPTLRTAILAEAERRADKRRVSRGE